MKNLIILVFALCAYTCAFAQAPQSINYQAIAWNSNNTPRANQTINVTLIIHNQSPTAIPAELTESHTVKTNDQGLFTIEIGSQKPADFQKINWAGGAKYLEVQIDGVIAGNTKMLSVPYALYAENTNIKAGSGITISDHTISSTGTTYSAGSGIAISSNNSISTDLKQGKGISINGNTISNIGDVDTTNEIQKLSLTGNVLTLDKKGGSVTLPTSGSGSSTTYTAGSGIVISPSNAISTDLKEGTGISIVGNTINNTGDIDSKNEIQTLSINGNTLSLSKEGGSVTLPTSGSGSTTTYSAGTGIAIDGATNKISATNGVPAGSIMAFAGAAAPDGWLICDGTSLSTSKYPELYAAIGINWGSLGSGSFSLPDLRGLFLRGVDGTAGNDTEKGNRTSKNGSNAGNKVGSYQDDQFQGHFHEVTTKHVSTQPVKNGGDSSNFNAEVIFPIVGKPITDGVNGTPRTGPETHPKNVYVLYIIKY